MRTDAAGQASSALVLTGGHGKSKIKCTNSIVKMDRLPDPPGSLPIIHVAPVARMPDTRFDKPNILSRLISAHQYTVTHMYD
jgi:hypothetical protein